MNEFFKCDKCGGVGNDEQFHERMCTANKKESPKKKRLHGEEKLIQWTKIVLAIIYGSLILWRVW